MARSMADKFLLTILGTLNEAQARWYVAREAIALGRGGIKAMQELTRLSKPTILRGIRELKTEDLPPPDRVRKSGGGRKRLEQSDPSLSEALRQVMEVNTAGDPMSLLRWTNKSTTTIAQEVESHDFPHLGKGTAIPHGTLDVERNEGFVNVGVSHDTAEFAVESVRRWWRLQGRRHYPQAKAVLICADSGGSNANRSRGWKYHLQQFANEFGLAVTVCHYPPGTSKWNKIEHRMFCFISLNWQGQPLISYQTVVNLIAGTRTTHGLRIKAKLDPREYEKGIPITKEQMK